MAYCHMFLSKIQWLEHQCHLSHELSQRIAIHHCHTAGFTQSVDWNVLHVMPYTYTRVHQSISLAFQ